MNRLATLVAGLLCMVAGLGLLTGDWVWVGLTAVANKQMGGLFTGVSLFCAFILVTWE